MIIAIFKSLFFKTLKSEAGKRVAKAVVDKCVDQGIDYVKQGHQRVSAQTKQIETLGLVEGLNNLTKRNLPDGDYPLRLEKQTLLVTMRNQGVIHIQYLNKTV
ncbi:hypothetical protein N480_10695 [Pseudoalteromonas luteoviolacea S2607]|uniref:hypothetical protein n=1 Tax=Pseudoalteromonas luteoviolacea TaxID=43657 RepID=UPI0007B0840F|nr:hypothetical protein [Pseudoalteromonas luteoviolacea]KZN28551.1 hypothetical protein N480_10695 [Pseudoalteromonas luteoviolacea S2607]